MLAQSEESSGRVRYARFAATLMPGASLDDIVGHTLTLKHTSAIRAHLVANYEAATANKMLSALRGTLKADWRLHLIETDPYLRAIDFQNVAGGSDEPYGRMLSLGEAISIFTACNDGTKAGARDAAMFAVAYSAGMRRAEVANVNIDDYDPSTGAIIVRRGKRNKTRKVPLPAGSAEAIDYWIELRGNEDGPLFPHIDKSDRIEMRYFTPQSVQLVFDKRSKLAKIQEFTPHDLRRTYISNLLDSGNDIATVQRLAGHSNVNTTSRYDRRGERAMFAAAKTLHVPFERPAPD